MPAPRKLSDQAIQDFLTWWDLRRSKTLADWAREFGVSERTLYRIAANRGRVTSTNCMDTLLAELGVTRETSDF